MRASQIGAVLAAGAITLIAACSAAPGPAPAAAAGGAHAVLPTRPMSYLGVYAPGVPASAAPVAAFSASAGGRVNMALYYSGWGEPFKVSFARALKQQGITPLVQVDPAGISLTAIADGAYDQYLRAYADSVRGFGHPVVMGFGHEMNGSWYSWGQGRTPPAEFIAAWRHIVDVFRSQGAGNVTWMWTINVTSGSGTGVGNPALWWPGAAYVDWVGIDGYVWYQWQDFASLFGPTLKLVRSFTGRPVIISETGINAASWQASKIPDLFDGAAKAGVLGLVWFDDDKPSAHGNPHDWRLTPAALADFHEEARSHQAGNSR